MTDSRRYSIVPIRALGCVRRSMTLRTLLALCAHTSKSGVCYPNQKTLGELIELDQAHVSRACKELWQLGLLRYLVPKGKKHPQGFKRGNRYQILYEPNAPLPSAKELEITEPFGGKR